MYNTMRIFGRFRRELKSRWFTTHEASRSDVDNRLFALLCKEKQRQRGTLNLIASENYASKAVLQALQFAGLPGAHAAEYDEGEDVNCSRSAIERLCKQRALQVFNLRNSEWCVNVSAFSGTAANLSVFSALLHPSSGRICGLSPIHGGHGSHGDGVPSANLDSFTSAAFLTMPYLLDVRSGQIDYAALQRTVDRFRPHLLIGGFSCATSHIDWARMRAIARRSDALLMADIAHVGGLVAGGAYPSPFAHADIVTMTTHKTLRGPRGSLIFYRRTLEALATKRQWHPSFHGNLEAIDEQVRRLTQDSLGASANHLAAIAVALKEACSDAYATYAIQTVRNAQRLEAALRTRGQRTFARNTRTQTHIVLWDLRDARVQFDTNLLQTMLDRVGLNANAYCVPSDDASKWIANGLRLGTPAMTSRGVKEFDFETVADFLVEIRVLLEALLITKPDLTLANLRDSMDNNLLLKRRLDSIELRVSQFATKFALPGFDHM